MQEAWIGAGGWGYFRAGTGPPLREYSRGFRFVEVNTTFYRHPSLVDARRWRRSVPEGFRFALKGHRAITHGERFRSTRKALSAIVRDAAIANVLRADIILLETPRDLPFEAAEVHALREFAAAVGGRVRLALEARAHAGRALPASLSAGLRDVGGIDVVDLSRGSRPRVESDTLYTRLLGKGAHNVWEFSDEELREIDAAARSQESNRMMFAFHGVRMYKDAARFVEFGRTGHSPPATKGRGLEGLREVLAPDARFPATREELLEGHGWKVIAAEGRGNIHASELLGRLPPRRFGSLSDMIAQLE